MSKEHIASKNGMGLGITFGAGLGIIFGEMIFDDVGTGLAIGTGIGIVLGGTYSTVSTKKKEE